MMTEVEMAVEQVSLEVHPIFEPLILEDIVIETLAIDGICGVY